MIESVAFVADEVWHYCHCNILVIWKWLNSVVLPRVVYISYL